MRFSRLLVTGLIGNALVAAALQLPTASRAVAQRMVPGRAAVDSATLRLILRIEVALAVAIEAHDRRGLDSLVAPDFTSVRSDGSSDTRASWFAAFDSVQYSTHRGSAEQISIYANSAIVTGVLQSKGRWLRPPAPFDYDVHYARIYVYDRARRRWQLREQLTRQASPNVSAVGPT